jgi:hypothetical protein
MRKMSILLGTWQESRGDGISAIGYEQNKNRLTKGIAGEATGYNLRPFAS